jgi:acetyl esterase/lipase
MARPMPPELAKPGLAARKPPRAGRRWRWFLSGAAVALAAAAVWNVAALVNVLARIPRHELTRGIPYDEGERQTLDVYRPAGGGPAPVIVFFSGGSWQSGAKETYRFVATTLVSRGYVVVIPDYRIYPEVRFPGFLTDGARAVAWASRHAADLGGDSRRLFVMGHSAGAYIAAMLALDGSWLKDAGLDPARDLAGLIGVSGPYDVLPLRDPVLRTIFDGDRPQTQPISFADGRKPPALLVTARTDDVVDPGNSQRLAQRLREHGNDATAILYRHGGHLTILGAFAPFVSSWLPVLDEIDAFVKRASAGTRP